MPLRTLVVDFNSYFASVEQQERPELRGRPIAVRPLAADTTFVIAASYPAKAHGVKTGVRVADARRLCPGLVLVEARPELYVRYHHRCLEAIETCLPLGTVLSIDEVACDVPPEFRTRTAATALATSIKAALRGRVGECLTASIGVAPNSLLAKLASDMEKPDGLVVLDDADLPARLLPLQLRDFSGIGPRHEERLRAHGITTVEQLWHSDPRTVRRAFGGVEGERFWRRVRGEDIPWQETHRSSVGHEHVLPPAMRHETAARAVLERLLQKAAMRLRHLGYHAGGLSVAVRHGDPGRTKWVAEQHFAETQDSLRLGAVLRELWARRPADAPPPHKVGVTLHRLVPAADHTPSLFDRPDERAPLFRAIDALNARLGRNTVYFGGAHDALQHAPTRIAFHHIPEAGEFDDAPPRPAPTRQRPQATAPDGDPDGDPGFPDIDGDPGWEDPVDAGPSPRSPPR